MTDNLSFAGKLALAHHDRDLVLLHQVRDALVELLRNRAAACNDLGEIERRLLVAEAIGVGVLHIMEDLGRAQQRLGWNAAPIEADSAQQLALDDRGLQTELRAADRRDIASGSGAEDDYVVIVSHLLSLSSRKCSRLIVWIERNERELAFRYESFFLAVPLAPDRFAP